MKLKTTASDIIVTSDWHLGNPFTSYADIWSILISDFKLLIINGDLIDHKNPLGPRGWRVINRLRLLEEQGKLVCVKGNHELWADKLPPLNFVDEFEWDYEGLKYLATHGHTLTPFFSKRGLEKRARKYANKHGYRVVLVGHNHCAHLEDDDGVIYVNTGSMLGFNNSVCVINEEQFFTLEYVNFKEIKTFFSKEAENFLNKGKISEKIVEIPIDIEEIPVSIDKENPVLLSSEYSCG